METFRIYLSYLFIAWVMLTGALVMWGVDGRQAVFWGMTYRRDW